MKSPGTFRKSLLRLFLISAWVPISILVLYVIRFGMFSLDTGVAMPRFDVGASSYLIMLVSWPCGMSITLAFQKMLRLERKPALLLIVIFAPLTAFAATVGGLLGAVGVAALTLMMSLPVWLIFFIRRAIHNRRLFRSMP